MKRYFAKPRAWCDDDVYLEEQPPHSMTVVETDSDHYTGLLNANGDPIYSSTRVTMGFIK